MNDIRVSSWHELNERLFEGSWKPSLGRFRSTYAFRGQPDVASDLRTSLTRLGEATENHLLRNFRKYAQREVVPGDSVWNWLAVAQHHGLPTRLLDWTYSPYVAMHFATEHIEHYALDGVIWCVDYMQTNQLLPDRLQGCGGDPGWRSGSAGCGGGVRVFQWGCDKDLPVEWCFQSRTEGGL